MADKPGNPEDRTPETPRPAGGSAPSLKLPESVRQEQGPSETTPPEIDAAESAGHRVEASDQAPAQAVLEIPETAEAAGDAAVPDDDAVTHSPPAGSIALDLPDFGGGRVSASEAESILLLNDVKLDVKIELGRANMRIEEVLQLGEGSVVELDKLAGDPVDVLVNERLVARGEVLVLNDNFCVRISEVLAGEEIDGGAR